MLKSISPTKWPQTMTSGLVQLITLPRAEAATTQYLVHHINTEQWH